VNVEQLNYGRCRDGSGRRPDGSGRFRPDGSGRLLVGPEVISCRVNCCRRPVMCGFNITIKRRRLATAADPATCEFYFYNIDIGDLPTPIRRCSSRLRCRRFSMSDVYIGRTLKISGGRGRPWEIVFGSYKTRHILLSNGANYTVLRAVVLTQYRRVKDGQTDGQMDGIAVANTALAM